MSVSLVILRCGVTASRRDKHIDEVSILLFKELPRSHMYLDVFYVLPLLL
ncbi:MAG: hypothetical protein JHC20_03850 [Pyrobaculum sp.]|nr:hypothetical protein [Pyrobaculum sp.]